jgi:RecJ-like exonuclease
MIGRMDLERKTCPNCKGTGYSPKNRKRHCSECENSGYVLFCKTCGKQYNKECLDNVLDQTYCDKRNMNED